jgi:putative oxidoreductase
MADLGLLVLRVAAGLIMAAHGSQKLFGWFGGYGIAGTGGFLETLGFRPGRMFAAAAGLSEFWGGLLIAVGLFGPVGPALVIATMTVAMLTVHRGQGLFAMTNGIELPLLYIVLAATLALTGFGALSLDYAVGFAAVWSPAAVWTILALGVLGGIGNLAVRRVPVAA